MSSRLFLFALCLIGAFQWTAVVVQAQELKFRSPRVADASTSVGREITRGTNRQSDPPSLAPPPARSRPHVGSAITQISRGNGELPNEHGQKWLEYDISPYTARVTSTSRPEQALVDWILRETGTEVWFSEPVGLLSASRDKLLVYHTEEMQEVVGQIVDRFVSSQAETHAFAMRLVTVGNPNWRSRALSLMRNVSAQSPGVDAWLLSKENAAILINELRKRTDFREHNSPNLVIHNGQSQTIARTRPRNYVHSVLLRENTFPGFEMEMGQIQEGYSLQISPLLSLDERTVDAVIRCHIDQVEKLIPISVEVPGIAPQRQAVQVQVPQMVSWRLHERFRWPSDQVLLLSCGVVASPAADRPNPLGLQNLLTTSPGRADALLFLESKGRASQTLIESGRTADRSNPNYRGRY